MKGPSRQIFSLSTATALAVLGDSLLYTILPGAFRHLGLLPYQVGILLSANRWVRLLSNYLSVCCCRRYPKVKWLLWALLGGSAISALYGAAKGFVLLLAARILWGICYSFIRQCGILTVVNAGPPENLAGRMGYYVGVFAMWQGIGIVLGGFSHDLFGFPTTLIALSILSLAAVPLARPSQRGRPSGEGERGTAGPRGGSPWRIHLGGFSVGLVGTGLIMSTLGLIIREKMGSSIAVLGWTMGAVSLTGVVISVRWVLDAFGSPLLGAASDRVGRDRSILVFFLTGALVLLSGALPLGRGWPVLVVVVTFICGSTLYTLLSGQAGVLGAGSLASYATAVDLGSSLGPCIGWGIAQLGWPLEFIFVIAGVFYLASGLGYVTKGRLPNLRDGVAKGRGIGSRV
jgi:MFS family permease